MCRVAIIKTVSVGVDETIHSWGTWRYDIVCSTILRAIYSVLAFV